MCIRDSLLLFCLILCISFSWLLVTFGACYFFKTYNLVVVLYYEYLCMVITMRCNFSVHAKTFMVGQKLDYLKSMRVICEKFWNFARKSAVCMFVDLNICCLIFINSYYPCFFGPPCISPLPQNSKRGCVLHWSYTAMRTRCLSGVHITLVITPVNAVHDLGVMLDFELAMQWHVNKVASACFYHIRCLKLLRRLIGPEITATLTSAFILSKLDYCNVILAGLPKSTITSLQRAQDAAAKLIGLGATRDHVTSTLQQLHWLPAQYCITYELCLLMHLIHTSQAPSYLTDIVT